MSTFAVSVRDIVPPEVLEEMARKRGQHPNVFKTTGKRPQWYFRYVIPVLVEPGQYQDKEQTKYLGECRGITKRQAERLRDDFLATINRPEIVIPSQIPMSHMLEQYDAAVISNLKPNTQVSYRSIIKAHIAPHFAHVRLCDVSKPMVLAWIGAKREHAPPSRRLMVAVLRSVFEAAIDWDYLFGKNPAKGVRIADDGRGKRLDIRALTADEARRLLAAADSGDPDLALPIRIAIYCGTRIGEILALTWADYDPARKTIRVKASLSQQESIVTGPKSAAGYRVLPAAPVALRRPAGARATDRIVASPVDYHAAEYRLNKLADAIGMNWVGFGWHTLRRTHATLMRQSGARNLREQLGHSEESMSQHYVRETMDDHAAAVGRIGEMLHGETKGKVQ